MSDRYVEGIYLKCGDKIIADMSEIKQKECPYCLQIENKQLEAENKWLREYVAHKRKCCSDCCGFTHTCKEYRRDKKCIVAKQCTCGLDELSNE